LKDSFFQGFAKNPISTVKKKQFQTTDRKPSKIKKEPKQEVTLAFYAERCV
jgi:hypothetical protein